MGHGSRRTARTRTPAIISRLHMATRCQLANLRRYRTNTGRCHRGRAQRQCNLPIRQLLRQILSITTLGTTPRSTLPLHHHNTHRLIYGSNSIRRLLRRWRLTMPRGHGTLRHRVRHHTPYRQRSRHNIRPNSLLTRICNRDTTRKCLRMRTDRQANPSREQFRRACRSLRLARQILPTPRQ